MKYDPATIAAISASALTIIAAIVSGTIAIIGAIGGLKKEQATIATAQTDKINKLTTTTEIIQGHVNSAASAANAKIDALERSVVSLTAQIADHRQEAALLAQSIATSNKLTDSKED